MLYVSEYLQMFFLLSDWLALQFLRSFYDLTSDLLTDRINEIFTSNAFEK